MWQDVCELLFQYGVSVTHGSTEFQCEMYFLQWEMVKKSFKNTDFDT